jgi:hypothetical protein
VERTERRAGHDLPLRSTGVSQHALGVDQDVGAQPAIAALDALEHGPRDLAGGERAAADPLRQLHGGGEAEIGGVVTVRPIEGCHGFAGVPRAIGGLGGRSEPPM